MRGAIGYNMKGHRPGLILLPFEFTTDAAGAVVAGSTVGEGYTVAQSTGTGRYTFTLTEKYTALLAGGFVASVGGQQALSVEVVSETVNSATPTITVCAMSPLNYVRVENAAALDTDGLHASMLSNAALDMTAGIIAGGNVILTANPRKVSATFSALWDGGDITFTGVDAITGLSTTETITAVAGSTVNSVGVYSSITALSHGVVGAGGALAVEVGYSDALSLGAYVNAAALDEVMVATDAAGALTREDPAAVTHTSVTPTTATDGAIDFVFIGSFRRPVEVLSRTVYGHFVLSSFGVRRA